jgi:hypothetical protein
MFLCCAAMRDFVKHIVERMESIMKMEVQASAHEACMAEVNAVTDTVLTAWETSEDQSENMAAEHFKYWRKRTGQALTCCSSQCPGALWQVCFCASVICWAAELHMSRPTSLEMCMHSAQC